MIFSLEQKIKDLINDSIEELNIKAHFDAESLFINKKQEFYNILVISFIDIEESDPKYKNFDIDDNGFLKGENKAVQDLQKKLNNIKFKYYGKDYKFSIFLEDEVPELTLELEYSTLKTYSFVEKQRILKEKKSQLEKSSEKNIFNDEETKNKFIELSELQRDKPEHQMLKTQHTIGGSVLSYQIEHIGDLTHRMSQKLYINSGSIESCFEDILPKIERGLRSLTSNYGFEKEFFENLKSNYDYIFKNQYNSYEEYEKTVLNELKKYSDEHSKLPVYNDAQYFAREAAISLGKLDFDKTIECLEKLNQIVYSENSIEQISTYQSKYKPKQKLKSKLK
tara:strand:+ start:7147 stop:8157 length:1011 start_codon:yes stop_codon:yes gene_type:complete